MVKKIVKGPTGSSKVKEQWRKVYDGIAKMREEIEAPVDVEGAHTLADQTLEPRLVRYQTLIGLLLSSQTKDPVTAKTIAKLQSQGLTPERMAEMSVEELAGDIHGVSFHNNKAKYIKKTSQILLEKYDGDVPNDFKKIIALPGIGPKMAHLFLQICFDKTEGIAVDTHVHRISNRLGWAKSKTPIDTMKQLQELLPKELWSQVNELLVGFGQTICTAKKPKCNECDIVKLCPYYKSKHKD